MPTMLCLDSGTHPLEEILSLFQNAGYDIVTVPDITDAFRLITESPNAYELVCGYPLFRTGTIFDVHQWCQKNPNTDHISVLSLAVVPNDLDHKEWKAKKTHYILTEDNFAAVFTHYPYGGKFLAEEILEAARLLLEQQARKTEAANTLE
jgi:hypothetical protein